jgi:NAD(P)-dependent dehydrogenase (short-subunit alcohol dehydrogenase family)
MSTPTDSAATWFITGTSRGLGLELTKQLLERGDNVAATTRSTADLIAALSGSGSNTERLLPIDLDLRDEKAVAAAISATTEHFGEIDVVVNNAGYGFLGAVEETTDAEVRAMFDIQVFGVWNVLRSVLPEMRARRSGHIINVSSIVGLVAFPGWGLYAAGKSALEGLSESLAAEVADFGIRVNIVEPGYLRTDFLRPVSLVLPTHASSDYPEVRAMTSTHQAMPGTQLGDPAKVAAGIIAVAVSGEAPLHQLFGSDSLAIFGAQLDALSAEVEAGRALATTSDIA